MTCMKPIKADPVWSYGDNKEKIGNIWDIILYVPAQYG